MIIDNNGRLFGKVSIIDVLIVALIFAACFFVAVRYFSSRDNPIGAGSSFDELEIKFYSEEVNNFVADAIKVGDAAKEFAQYANFGTVVNGETDDSITWVGDFDGFINPSSKDGHYSSITVTTRARGRINEIGFELDGTNYFVGKTVIMQFGKAGFQGRIAGVERVADIEAGAVVSDSTGDASINGTAAGNALANDAAAGGALVNDAATGGDLVNDAAAGGSEALVAAVANIR